METPENKKKSTWGDVMCYEPQNLDLVNADPAIRIVFE